MNKLEVGMYVRFENVINKIIEIDEDYIVFDMNWYDHWANEISAMRYDLFIEEYKPRFSYNIIDLIEVGDYVNGYRITLIHETKTVLYAEDEKGYLIKSFGKEDIKSIVTKEQFKSMEYRLGESND